MPLRKKTAVIQQVFVHFDLVPYGWLLMKIAASGVDSKVDVWVKEILLGRSPRVRLGGQLCEEVRVMQGSVLGPLLFLAYVNDTWRSLESTIKLFANDCIKQENYE